MHVYLYTFTYLGHAVDYRIMARNKTMANLIARTQERAWRLAIEELSSWN